MSEYMSQLYKERRAMALSLLGEKCVACGREDKLHVDHIDPKSKEFGVMECYGFKLERWLRELAKCQLLCNSCHTKKTVRDNGMKKVPVHGTLHCYQKAKCRCDLCRAANAAVSIKHSRAYRARQISSEGGTGIS